VPPRRFHGGQQVDRALDVDFLRLPERPGTAGHVYHQQGFEISLDPAHPLATTPFFGDAGPASLHVE
jgi:hypothetical protein